MNKFRRYLINLTRNIKTYRYVNCIVSNNNSPVDLLYKPTNTTDVEIDWYVPNVGTVDASTNLTGSVGANRYYLMQNNETNTYYYSGTRQYPFTIDTTIYNKRATWKYGKRGFFVDDVRMVFTGLNTENDFNIYVLGVNDNGVVREGGIKDNIKVYAIKIYENDVLVAHLLPIAYSTGEAGFHDTIRDLFFRPVQGVWQYE